MPKTLTKVKRRIYLDYASLTPIDPRVLLEVNKYLTVEYANPSSWYREGVSAKKTMDEALKSVANFLHAHADEIVFTSGGTEANNMALLGVFGARQNKKPHIVVSAIEHSSIMETARTLEGRGCELSIIPVDKNGIVDLVELKKSIKTNTVLVSIMTVNNEIGSIQPIREIAKIVRQARAKFAGDRSELENNYPLFHTDAAQAGLFNDLNVEQLGVDLLTLDGGKIYGPRGIGALYVKRYLLKGGISVTDGQKLIQPIMFGGGQEGGMRSGTENVGAICGFAKALEIAHGERMKETARLIELKDFFVAGLKKIRPDIIVNVGGINVSPHIISISIPNIDNEFFVMQLDAAGVACSTKSSCLRDQDESYVLKAVGADSTTSVRFSLGRWTKKGDIVAVLKIINNLLA